MFFNMLAGGGTGRPPSESRNAERCQHWFGDMAEAIL
jgi:hypothetical protein